MGAQAKRLWPQAPELELRPLSDVSKGDLTTAFCLSAAAVLRLRPEEIGSCLINELPSDFPAEVELVEGHINLRLIRVSPLKGRGCLKREKIQGCPRSFVVFMPLVASQNRLGLLRQLSVALIQFGILRGYGAHCQFCFGETLCFDSGSANTLCDMFALTLDEVSAGMMMASSAVRRRLETLLEADRDNKVFAKLPWRALDAGDFAGLAGRYKDRLLLMSDEKPWQISSADAPWCTEALSRKPFQQAALMAYLAGPLAADDCDPAVPLLEERSNHLWQLWCTLRRMQAGGVAEFCGKKEGAAIVELSELSAEERELFVRSLLLPEFYYRAGFFGEVRSFIEALESFAALFGRFFNAPARRLACRLGAVSRVDREIMAGVWNALSGIMEQWELCQIWSAGADSPDGMVPGGASGDLVGPWHET